MTLRFAAVVVLAMGIALPAEGGPVITVGPQGSSSFPVPDYSPIERGMNTFGQGAARGIEKAHERRRAEKEAAARDKALAAVAIAGLEGGEAAALIAAAQNPVVFSHPQFPVILQLIRERE